MPRGHKPGTNGGGGRKPGQLGKATIERAAIAQAEMDRARMIGTKLGKEVISDFMVLFQGIAARYQPRVIEGQADLAWPAASEEKFYKYGKLALQAASELAAFQSPKLKAVELHVAPTAPIENRQAGNGVTSLSPQQAYRLLRDDDVIDLEPTKAAPAKAVRRG